MKKINAVCGQDAEFLYVAADVTIRLKGFINLHRGYVNNALVIQSCSVYICIYAYSHEHNNIAIGSDTKL